MYCNTCPCLGCTKKIIQVGIKEVVYDQAYGMDNLSARLFTEAGVILRQHKSLPDWISIKNEYSSLHNLANDISNISIVDIPNKR